MTGPEVHRELADPEKGGRVLVGPAGVRVRPRIRAGVEQPGASGLGGGLRRLALPTLAAQELLDRRQAARGSVQSRPAGEQPAGVGVLGALEDRDHVALFDESAFEHDGDVVGDLGDHPEIVRDEEDRHVALVPQPAQQVEDLRLDRDVERRRRLVGDQQSRPGSERHGDHHALLLAAGHLVRIAVEAPFRLGDADLGEELEHPQPGFAPAHLLVGADRLDDLLADLEDRVERRARLLEDHRDLGAAQGAQVAPWQPHEIAPEVGDPAVDDLGRVGQQPEKRQRSHRLPRPRFPDQSERAPGRDREAHAVHRRLLTALEAGAQVLDLQEPGFPGAVHGVGVYALRGGAVAASWASWASERHRSDGMGAKGLQVGKRKGGASPFGIRAAGSSLCFSPRFERHGSAGAGGTGREVRAGSEGTAVTWATAEPLGPVATPTSPFVLLT